MQKKRDCLRFSCFVAYVFSNNGIHGNSNMLIQQVMLWFVERKDNRQYAPSRPQTVKQYVNEYNYITRDDRPEMICEPQVQDTAVRKCCIMPTSTFYLSGKFGV